jgi:hypothetical protein
MIKNKPHLLREALQKENRTSESFDVYPWRSRDIHEYPWRSTDIHGFHGSIDMHGHPRDVIGFSWIFMSLDILGCPLICMDFTSIPGYPWISMDIQG